MHSFYLLDGERASGNGGLIAELAACVGRAGRDVASPDEARVMLGLFRRTGGQQRIDC